MAKNDWEVGDIVELKSGSPPMTVQSVEELEGAVIVYCVWFDGTVQMSGSFQSEALQAASAPSQT